jgi:hypothetical protein
MTLPREESWSEGALVTKSIRLTEEEAAEVARYLCLVGGTEAALLKEAALRGLRDIRLGRGILAYLEGAPREEAQRIAGLPRAPFLHALAEHGVTLLRGPSTIGEELEMLLAAEAQAAEGSDDETSWRPDQLNPRP